jgi:PAS domain S-box-containing protein
VSEIESRVRIVVVLPEAFAGGLVPVRDSRRTLDALARLGSEASVEPAASLEAAAAEVRNADLLVLDGSPPAAASGALEAARAARVPAVAVVADSGDADAVAWFRLGVADCVAEEGGALEALPAAALEQIRRGRDTRQRRSVERRLAWLENLNTTIVNEIPAALAVLDAERKVVATNPAFGRAFGTGVRGRPLAELLPADLWDSADFGALLDRVAAGEAVAPTIARGHGSDGRAVVFDVRGQRLDDAGRLLVVLADVTEREMLARRITDLQRYNENIIQNLNSALLVVDTEGAVTFANAMAAEILGEPGGVLRGRSVWDWFSTAHVQGGLLARTLAEGSRFRGAETMLARADGRAIPVGISCAPLVDADGTRLGAVAIFQDLTEITLLQRQVLQTEKMASIGQLAAGVAHEINNPMGFIHANLFQMAEYLGDVRRLWTQVGDVRKAAGSHDAPALVRASETLEELARELDAEYVLTDFDKAIRESQEGAERIRHIVRDLRDFSRQDRDERVAADVNQCLDSTANIVWSMMKHSVVLRKRYGDLPRIRCNPMQLKQVFMNLLVNAYQAIETRLAGTGERGEIDLVSELRGDCLAIEVSDTGCGIAPEQLDRIFDPFFTTKEVGVGVGLGLSTSFSIVQKHGGTLRARNRSGHGASFELILPLTPSEEVVAGEAG